MNLFRPTVRLRLTLAYGGLFLFLPSLAAIPLDRLFRRAGLPGSEMIPAGCALRSLLALKLFGTARHPHVMSSVLDEGLALFAGLISTSGTVSTQLSLTLLVRFSEQNT